MHGVTPVIFAQGAMVCERSQAYVVQLRKPPTSYLPASNASWSATRDHDAFNSQKLYSKKRSISMNENASPS